MIHMTVKMVLEKSRNATAHCSGKSSTLLFGSRIKNRHMETLVYANFEVSMTCSRQRRSHEIGVERSNRPFVPGSCLASHFELQIGKVSSEMYVPT